MHRLNRKNWLEIGVMTVIFAIAAILVYKTTILTRMTLPRTATQAQAEKGKTETELNRKLSSLLMNC